MLHILASYCFLFSFWQKEERVSELRNQLSERQALRSRRRPSSANQNHSSPPLPTTQNDPKSLLPPPGYPLPASDNHSLPPTFSNSSVLYQPDGKINRNNCHPSRLQLLYKWDMKRNPSRAKAEMLLFYPKDFFCFFVGFVFGTGGYVID